MRDEFIDTSGNPTQDEWQSVRTGFRVDKEIQAGNFSLQGEYYRAEIGQIVVLPTFTQPYMKSIPEDSQHWGGHIQSRLQSRYSENSELIMQIYFDTSHKRDLLGAGNFNTLDIDTQSHIQLGHRQDIVCGLGYRYTFEKTMGSLKISFDPANSTSHLFSGFIQDEIELLRDRLTLTAGSKFERNYNTGFEYQPNLRVMWKPTPWQTVWASGTRAVRTPSRADTDIRIAVLTVGFEEIFPGGEITGPPVLLLGRGDSDFESEDLRSFEFGYRIRPTSSLYLDISSFYNEYSNLGAAREEALEANLAAKIPYFVQPVTIENLLDGATSGFEIAADWVRHPLRLRGNYAYLRSNFQLRPEANSLSPKADYGSPAHQAILQTSLTPSTHLRLDGTLRYVSELPDIDVDPYLELDIRLAWRPDENIELSVTAQNLLNRQHAEFVDLFFGSPSTEIQRGLYSAISWAF